MAARGNDNAGRHPKGGNDINLVVNRDDYIRLVINGIYGSVVFYFCAAILWLTCSGIQKAEKRKTTKLNQSG